MFPETTCIYLCSLQYLHYECFFLYVNLHQNWYASQSFRNTVLLGSYSTQTSVYLNVLANCKREFIQKYLQVTKTSLKVSHIKSERTNSEHQVLFWPKQRTKCYIFLTGGMVYIKQKWRQTRVTDVGVKKIPVHVMKFLCSTLQSECSAHKNLPYNCSQTITLSYFWCDYPRN